jgi:trehalose 6-phosphate synthase
MRCNAFSVAPTSDCRARVRADLGLPEETPLIVCIDRLDYTKGFEERLASFSRLLDGVAAGDRRPALLQVGAPSRTLVERYRDFSDRIHRQIDLLNDRFRTASYTPVTFVNRHCDRAEVTRFYRAADVCYVSSLHDGMKLVAKEFVAARDDEDGVLVLSQFAGAACELSDAVIVNPYDIDRVADTLVAALRMPRDERIDRMQKMRNWVRAHNVYRWAGLMLSDAAAYRHQHVRGHRLVL